MSLRFRLLTGVAGIVVLNAPVCALAAQIQAGAVAADAAPQSSINPPPGGGGTLSMFAFSTNGIEDNKTTTDTVAGAGTSVLHNATIRTGARMFGPSIWGFGPSPKAARSITSTTTRLFINATGTAAYTNAKTWRVTASANGQGARQHARSTRFLWIREFTPTHRSSMSSP